MWISYNYMLSCNDFEFVAMCRFVIHNLWMSLSFYFFETYLLQSNVAFYSTQCATHFVIVSIANWTKMMWMREYENENTSQHSIKAEISSDNIMCRLRSVDVSIVVPKILQLIRTCLPIQYFVLHWFQRRFLRCSLKKSLTKVNNIFF